MRTLALSMVLAAGMSAALGVMAAAERFDRPVGRPVTRQAEHTSSRRSNQPLLAAPATAPMPVTGMRSATIRPPAEVVRFAGGTLKVEFDASQFAMPREDLIEWVRESARATAAYFGRFPVTSARITFEPTRGAHVVQGRAVGRPEPHIVVLIGRDVRGLDLAHESLLVHEMVHLAVPDHDIRHLWLHEGIATYVENVARAQAGQVMPEEVWEELVRELPEGLPGPREMSGLDGTPSDGRRYWGGALYCLLADIEIRRATANRIGLQDALRALQRQGGNLSRLWTLERTLDVADRATATDVMANLYAQMGKRPYAPDLNRLWRDLGIASTPDGRVELIDTAPLAAIRRAITGSPSAPLLVAEPRLVRTIDIPRHASAR